MRIIVFHQPFPQGNYKLNECVANYFISKGHEVYLLEQLNGRQCTPEFVEQIKEVKPDMLYFEMLDSETFKVVEQIDCEKILVYASKGVLKDFKSIIEYKDKWYTKVYTNSLSLQKMFEDSGIPNGHYQYYPSAITEEEISFESKYQHDCTFLGMGFNRVTEDPFEANIWKSNYDFDFKIYGTGWPQFKYYGGLLPREDIGKLYSSAKSCYSVIGMTQRKMGQINNRYTEIMYSGAPIISYDYEHIDWFGAKEHMNLIKTHEDFVNVVNNIKNNPGEFRASAENLKLFIREKHDRFFWGLDNIIGE
tara:strand:+ start:1214 stop:2131 length:918 start_codon:yes stop_codon:yes gene_type:complete